MDKAAFHKGKSPFFGKGRCIRSQEPLPRPPMFADFHLRNGFRPLPKETFLEKWRENHEKSIVFFSEHLPFCETGFRKSERLLSKKKQIR